MPIGPRLGVDLASFAVSRDGQRSLILAWPREAASSPIVATS
jgi:hypothetical protein